MTTIYILYLITNLGPVFKFEKKDVLAAYETIELCRAGYDIMIKTIKEPYMRMECVDIDFYGKWKSK